MACGLNPAGFNASAITLVEGSSRFVSDLLLHQCAYTAGKLDQNVVFVDGGNSFNPYTLQRITSVQQADPGTVLKKIHVARAFTEYQMNDLLVQQLTSAISQWEPGMLAVAYLPYLFSDLRVRGLLEQSLEHVTKLTRDHSLRTIITSYGGTWWGARLTEKCSDRVIRVVQRRNLIQVMDESDVFEFMPVPTGQMRLDAYAAVV